ncbi:MAG: hypothetical protein FWE76_05810, partial [Symbiobacteriaceae bacterium]|nr:hypothetical protein [Symbiobacteriaceae bacterium]
MFHTCSSVHLKSKERIRIIPDISIELARQLIDSQFPRWQNLPVVLVEPGGHDNHSFRLGNEMVIRLPSAECYMSAISKERAWLPVFTRSVSLRIPIPIAKGEPSDLFPWSWTINRWIEGETLRADNINSMNELAHDLANFLRELQTVSTERGVVAGEQNFHRGGDLR